MGNRFYRNWLLSFVALFLIDVIWHALLFPGFYVRTMGDVVRIAGGRPAPLIPVIAVGDILTSLGYTYFVTATSIANKRFLANGVLAGLVLQGPFTIWNYALIVKWDAVLAAFDLVYAAVQGVIQGFLLMRLNRSAEKTGRMA